MARQYAAFLRKLYLLCGAPSTSGKSSVSCNKRENNLLSKDRHTLRSIFLFSLTLQFSSMHALTEAPKRRPIEISGIIFKDYAQEGKSMTVLEVRKLIEAESNQKIRDRLETSQTLNETAQGLTYLWFLTLIVGAGLSQTDAGAPVLATSFISLALIFPTFWLSDVFFVRGVKAYNEVILEERVPAVRYLGPGTGEYSMQFSLGVQRF